MSDLMSRRRALAQLVSAPAALTALPAFDVPARPRVPEPIPVPLTDEDGFEWWTDAVLPPAAWFDEPGIAWHLCDWTGDRRWAIVYFADRPALAGFATSSVQSVPWVREAVARFLGEELSVGRAPGFLVVVNIQRQPFVGRVVDQWSSTRDWAAIKRELKGPEPLWP